MKEERKRILDMVERGSLSASEAITLLEELEKSSKSAGQKEQEIMNDLSVVVDQSSEKKSSSSYGQYKNNSAKDKLFDLVDTVIKKVRELDLDLNFGQSVEISHIFQHNAVNVTDIDISIANGSVKLVPTDQEDVRIECEAKVYRADNQDEARKALLDSVIFIVEGSKLKFLANEKWMKLDAVLYVPDAAYEKIRAKLFNGPVTGENLRVEDLKAKTGNGKISFKGVSGEKLEAETANGHIKLKRCAVERVDAETINGGIKLAGPFAKADLRTFNGGIECEVQGDCDFLSAKAVTGGIEIYVPAELPVDGELRSNLGGFQVDLDRIQLLEEKSEMIQKLLRFKTIQEQERVSRIVAETKTGGISVRKATVYKKDDQE
ncbi:hypothetical protein A8F94_10325 [Bacillus sp. FJAT-27225]|uniref:DUF4097 family beta strand repeat-containing protein n=1 Tax=Bacillus sp. FJAT-27225 TaxID=1743144 RepID=UPI00080C237F|nr:DUF4097 domain-containing protein [Bacillus sp. FJAT-27225]OCA88195.1 hypothetical protein A8F94_10325 [Bacillus sp. FJAT-27225]